MWITASDLTAALGDEKFAELYNDGTGTPNAAWIAQDIKLAEARVNGRLFVAYNRGLPTAPNDLVMAAALEYAKAYALDRHTEYAKTTGKRCLESADALMKNIVEGSQLAEASGPTVSDIVGPPDSSAVMVGFVGRSCDE